MPACPGISKWNFAGINGINRDAEFGLSLGVNPDRVKKLGMETMLVLTGEGKKTLRNFQHEKSISYFAENIYEGFKQLCH